MELFKLDISQLDTASSTSSYSYVAASRDIKYIFRGNYLTEGYDMTGETRFN